MEWRKLWNIFCIFIQKCVCANQWPILASDWLTAGHMTQMLDSHWLRTNQWPIPMQTLLKTDNLITQSHCNMGRLVHILCSIIKKYGQGSFILTQKSCFVEKRNVMLRCPQPKCCWHWTDISLSHTLRPVLSTLFDDDTNQYWLLIGC